MNFVNGRILPAWPLFGLEDDIRAALSVAQDQSAAVAVATLIGAEGGSPRPVGAQMAVGRGVLSGYLSGGCIEADLANHAIGALDSNEPRWLVYGRGGPWDLPLPCGGRIEVHIDPIPAGDPALRRLLEFTAAREPCIWLTDGRDRRCERLDQVSTHPAVVAGMEGGRVFRRYDPPLRLVVVGSDPVTLAICSLAICAGMETFLVNPKGPRVQPAIEGLRYSRLAASDALEQIGLDPWTAVAACTHDVELDHEVLACALRSPCFYVAALGSTRRKAQRLAALKSSGLSTRELRRLRTPMGLPIHASSPWEIAVSTLGELIRAFREAEGVSWKIRS